MPKNILSIDQGTTSSRAVLFDEKCNLIDYAQKEITQYYPSDGWVEHDPEEIWRSVLGVTNEIISKHQLSSTEVGAIGITNQRETTILWDKRTGKSVYPAIVWQDRRTSSLCQKLKDEGLTKTIREKTGLLIDPYFSATKLAWVLDHVEGARKKAEKGELAFGTVDSFLVWKLTEGKKHKTDVTNASRTMLFNINENSWDNELLRLFRIPEGILPEVCDNVQDYGETSLFGGSLKIGGVAGDQQAALIGQGCFEPGEAKSTYGTGCFLLLNTGNQRINSENDLLSTISYRIENKTTYGLEGSIFVAGSAIQWLRDSLRLFESANETEKIIKSRNKDSKLLVVPAFTGLGAPHWDPEARGAIFGLTRDSGIPELTAATLESIAFQTRDLIEAMVRDGASFTELRIDGGMANNSWFVQQLANTLNISVLKPKAIETTARGAALLAGIQAGFFSNISSLRNNLSYEKIFEPEKEKILATTNKYNNWLSAVERTKGLFNNP